MSSKRKYIKRLQGKEFADMLPELRLVAYLESFKGNICGFYAPNNRKLITILHWMNDEDKKQFLQNKHNVIKLSSQKEALGLRIFGDTITNIWRHNNSAPRG